MGVGSTYLRRDGRWESRLSLGVINGKRQSSQKHLYKVGKMSSDRIEKLRAVGIIWE